MIFTLQFTKTTSNQHFEKSNTNLPHNMSKLKACNRALKSIRKDNHNRLTFVRLNINSLKNKFELLIEQVKGNTDVLMISKTKID